MITSSTKVVFEDILLIAYGINASRIIAKGYKNSVESIPSGRLYFVHGFEDRKIDHLIHNEALIEVDTNEVFLMTSQAEHHSKTEILSVQSNMQDEFWNEMKRNRSILQKQSEWIEADPQKLIDFVVF